MNYLIQRNTSGQSKNFAYTDTQNLKTFITIELVFLTRIFFRKIYPLILNPQNLNHSKISQKIKNLNEFN